MAEVNNGKLIVRLFGLAWRYRLHCCRVLGIQLILLTMGLFGLSFTGIGIDYIRHEVQGTPISANKLHLVLPADWKPLKVLLLLAALIMAMAVCRAILNYVYQVSVNILVQQKLVVDLRGEVYDKLQRLSFRFFIKAMCLIELFFMVILLGAFFTSIPTLLQIRSVRSLSAVCQK